MKKINKLTYREVLAEIEAKKFQKKCYLKLQNITRGHEIKMRLEKLQADIFTLEARKKELEEIKNKGGIITRWKGP
mgnify:CR=1